MRGKAGRDRQVHRRIRKKGTRTCLLVLGGLKKEGRLRRLNLRATVFQHPKAQKGGISANAQDDSAVGGFKKKGEKRNEKGLLVSYSWRKKKINSG